MREQKLFLALLRDHIHSTATAEITEGIDWEQLFSYAEEQSLCGVCYVQLKALAGSGKHIPEEILEKFHQGFFYDCYASANRQAYMKEAEALLQEADIPFQPFKGWILKDYWPVPELRTMGDIDLLIHTTDRDSSNAIMQELGFQRLVDNHAVWTYYAKDIIFELHDHMFYEHLTNEVDYPAYFDRAWDYVGQELWESFHFLYLITHLAKHTINKGMGFRAYLDLIFFCRTAEERLQWDWIFRELERLKLRSFAETCFVFCRAWFGYQIPESSGRLDNSFYRFVTDKLFNDGTFGLENGQNEAAGSAKEISHSRAPYWLGAITLTVRRLFPPYEDMQLIPWYSFVDGRPWLLPAAWIYRWWYSLTHKRVQGEKLLLEPFRKKKMIEKRQKLIRDWGL